MTAEPQDGDDSHRRLVKSRRRRNGGLVVRAPTPGLARRSRAATKTRTRAAKACHPVPPRVAASSARSRSSSPTTPRASRRGRSGRRANVPTCRRWPPILTLAKPHTWSRPTSACRCSAFSVSVLRRLRTPCLAVGRVVLVRLPPRCSLTTLRFTLVEGRERWAEDDRLLRRGFGAVVVSRL